MITLERTTKREIPQIYALYRTAFPRGERKPFSRILKTARAGKTDLWTIRRNGKFAGFASTVNGEELILLDYYAVRKSLRGLGVGSAALRELMECYRDRGFFVEIESTLEKADNQAEREARKRFYVNCGMIPMETEANLFGIRMELLGVRCHLNFNEYRDFYRNHYSPWAAQHIKEVL